MLPVFGREGLITLFGGLAILLLVTSALGYGFTGFLICGGIFAGAWVIKRFLPPRE